MKYILFHILALFGLIISGIFASHVAFATDLNPRACLINFERRRHPLSAMINKKFSGISSVRIINEAKPIDLLKCIDDGVESIMILGHAGDLNSKNQTTAPLLYFKELKGQARVDFLNNIRSEITRLMNDFKDKVKKNEFINGTASAIYFQAFEMNDKIKNFPENRPIYGQPKLIENQIWKRILSNPKNLKKINIVSCLPEKVFAYYPELMELNKQGVKIQFGPTNKIMSIFMGEKVASPDFEWMKKEIL